MNYTPGTKVRLIYTGEVGVVIYGWENSELGVTDYHIAFYGTELPINEPKNPPYILRYSESSLELYV